MSIDINALLPMVKEQNKQEFIELIIAQNKSRDHSTVDDIELSKFISAICEWSQCYHSIGMKEIQSKSRLQDIVYIRHIALYCIQMEFSQRMTLTRLAAIFNRHHASVIHAHKRCANTLGYDKKLNQMLISLNEYLQLRGFNTLANVTTKIKTLDAMKHH
jgi:chromosomal replication initiation ATPase DnaA